jgi:hypothetical protein
MSKMTELGLRHPDQRDVPLTGFGRKVDALYSEQRLAVFMGSAPAEVVAYLESKGIKAIMFPESPAAWPEIFTANAEYFQITRRNV